MHWELVIAAVAFLFSVLSYAHTQRNALAWKRTEFLCEQLLQLDTVPDLVAAVKILEGRGEITISDIFGPESTLTQEKKNESLQEMDKLLNFFWRLSYAFLVTKTITKKEVEGFSWYFGKIDESPSLRKYCEETGYKRIITTIELLPFVEEMRLNRADGGNKQLKP